MNFNEMSINRKLLLAFLVMILLSGGGGFLSWYLLDSVRAYQKSKNQMRDFSTHLAAAREAEQNFLLFDQYDPAFYQTGGSQNINEFHKELDSAKILLEQLHQDDLIHHLALDGSLDVIRRELLAYERNFDLLHTTVITRGFKDWGLIGEMRSHAHKLLEAVSPEEQVFALTLRRHEKDYLLRKDPKYATRINNTAKEYIAYLKAAQGEHFTAQYKAQAISGIQAYQKHFGRIVSAVTLIGTDQQQGIMQDIHQSSMAIDPLLLSVNAKVDEAVAAIYPQSLLTLVVSMVFLIITGILLSWVLTKHLGKPIARLDKIVNTVLAGDISTVSELKSSSRKDQIGNLINHFREMMLMLQQSMKEASLKNEKLEQAAREEAARSWVSEGLHTVGEAFKHQDQSIEDFCYEVLKALAHYTGTTQGSLYLLEQDQKGTDLMRCKACYASDRRKRLDNDFYIGEGLIGAAWIENDEIFLTEVPKGYMTIRTGLGATEPTCIYIVPVRSERGVEAIIELASLKTYEAREKELIRKLAERLGAIIASIRMQADSRQLLSQTQRMATELQANEEEMRQNMEELQATQEESSRQYRDLQERYGLANEQLARLKGIITTFYKGMIVADASQQILEANDYGSSHLRYQQQDLKTMHLDDCFVETIPAQLKSMTDRTHLAHEPVPLHLLDSFGSAVPVEAVFIKLTGANQNSTVCLFNSSLDHKSRKNHNKRQPEAALAGRQ